MTLVTADCLQQLDGLGSQASHRSEYLLVWTVSITPEAKEGSALHKLICTNTV
jgi:hypothetical protein